MQSVLRYIVLFYPLLFLCFILETVNSPASQSKEKLANGGPDTKTIDNKNTETIKISAKESVLLLEQILQKMHTMPQIALSRTKQSLELDKTVLADKKSNPSSICDAAPIIASSKGTLSNQRTEAEYEQKDKKQAVAGAEPLFSSTPGRPRFQWAPSYNQLHSNALSLSGQFQNSVAQSVRGSANIPKSFELAKSEDALSERRVSEAKESQYVERNGSIGGITKHAGSPQPSALSPSIPRATACKSFSNMNLSLLPPTVIKGIPLVSLNDSEHEVLERIAKTSTLVSKKEAIHDWSVFSLRKHNSSTCAIQIFLRKGIVEAIRVFDSSFLRQDFGVEMGNDLSKVKEKYGEPSFILTEKNPRISQNYIYPLNQVAFQFSRSAICQSPEITSMIIFNVQ